MRKLIKALKYVSLYYDEKEKEYPIIKNEDIRDKEKGYSVSLQNSAETLREAKKMLKKENTFFECLEESAESRKLLAKELKERFGADYEGIEETMEVIDYCPELKPYIIAFINQEFRIWRKWYRLLKNEKPDLQTAGK